MEEIQKRPRGRPRKFPESAMSGLKYSMELLTDRSAQNQLYWGRAMHRIGDHCPIETQKYFFGGLTHAEVRAGARAKTKVKKYVMEELGRHPIDEIPGIAEAIANNRAFDDWTQKEIVEFLRRCRLGKSV
jgi:hypothetical protein